MTSHQEILREIQRITGKLISIGLSVAQNFPTTAFVRDSGQIIAYEGIQDLSIALKNIDYKEIYDELEKGKNYNIKMVDGALIQFLYTYKRSELVAHGLAFFPSPYLAEFQNNPEIYEEDEVYADITAKNILPVSIRFDYDPDNHQELDHPKCHLTLGQFKNCRIPVCSPNHTLYLYILYSSSLLQYWV
jgi:hypothetical protein